MTAKQIEAKIASLQRELTQVKDVESGDSPSPAQAALIKSQPYSYGVHFERKKVLRKVKSPGAICVSVRRFTSRKEADQHGRRFAKKHGHKGYDVVRTNKRANAWVNWKTGKTNPVLN